MFDFERVKASKQLQERRINFVCSHGYFRPDKLQDLHTIKLSGIKQYRGNEGWFNKFIDSDEFREHFDSHTVTYLDEIVPADTPPPSAFAERVWNTFAT